LSNEIEINEDWDKDCDEEPKKRFMDKQLGHEKLHVYQRGLTFVSWKESLFAQTEGSAAVLDHLNRASESIVQAIANGNSRRSPNDRNRYFDVALGSGLECAACLDICVCKQLISREMQTEGKEHLQHIVRMTMGLKAATNSRLREEAEPYVAGDQGEIFFAHEKLDVYQLGLELIRWLDGFLGDADIPARYSTGLDKTTTSFVLNVAEGNGRFSDADQRRFLDIAHTCLMNTASGLDVLMAKHCVNAEQIDEGKRMLVRLVALLLGLRGSLENSG